MSYQITKVDLIPNGEIVKCNASQFDNGRVLPFEIYENKVAYNIPNDTRVELHCRKPDGNIVTLPSDTITDNIVTFITTTQLTACYGDNVCEIALYGADDYLIGSANFILEVEKSPTYGGINSTSDIHNLETQVEEITTEIVGENYYNKTEVDTLLDDKADADNVYTKSQTDTLLDDKADADNVYTKSQTDTLLDDKADADNVYTKSQTDTLLGDKADVSDVYNKTEIDNKILDIMPVDTASGAIAEFNTQIAAHLVSVIADVTASGGGGTPDNPNPINGYTEANITRWGVNLFQTTATSKSEAGVDWNVNADGTISVSGVASGYTSLEVGTAKVNNRMGVVTISGIASATNIAWNVVELRDADNNTLYTVTNGGLYTSFTVDLTSYSDLDNIRISLKRNNNTAVSGVIKPQVELGNEVTTYQAYKGQTYTIAFGQTVYGGVLDVTRGKLKPCIEYPSYNGEILSGRWLSSEATYIEGTTPPTGSQVVSLDDYGSDIDLTPVQIRAIVGTNNVFADTNGNTTVKFKDTIQNYIDKKVST